MYFLGHKKIIAHLFKHAQLDFLRVIVTMLAYLSTLDY